MQKTESVDAVIAKRGTRGGFHASFGRGDPCTQDQSQSCAQRTTLLSVKIKFPSPSRARRGANAREGRTSPPNLRAKCRPRHFAISILSLGAGVTPAEGSV